MPVTSPERYVVASCHVERPLDDRVWASFATLQERRPGGIAVAALMRPPAEEFGETDVDLWVERAREAAARGPLGHHTHWTSPTHARPTGAGDPGERVAREGAWLQERGLAPTLFCGGGWFTDVSVASACARLGYADCTPRATRPPYLPDGAPWAELTGPAVVELPGGDELLALPTTHSAGDGCRAALGRRLPTRAHLYFHDTDLVDRRRRIVVEAALRALGSRLRGGTLDEEAARSEGLPRVDWSSVARGEAGARR
jgi:hypothetical protein